MTVDFFLGWTNRLVFGLLSFAALVMVMDAAGQDHVTADYIERGLQKASSSLCAVEA